MNTYAKYNQSGEDYLESILTLGREKNVVHRIDVARRMNVSQVAVTKAVKLLCERGYVYEDGKHLYLTENGLRYAQAVYDKHCVIREFLTALGVSPATAEDDACHMEHAISDSTFQGLKALLEEKRAQA